MLRQFSRIYALTTVKEFVFNKVVCSFTEKNYLTDFFKDFVKIVKISILQGKPLVAVSVIR